MKQKIDFRQIEIEMLDGNNSTVDISKELGNQIYQKTADLGELELAREIYRDGEVEIDHQQSGILSAYISSGFLAFVQEAACRQLEALFADDNSYEHTQP